MKKTEMRMEDYFLILLDLIDAISNFFWDFIFSLLHYFAFDFIFFFFFVCSCLFFFSKQKKVISGAGRGIGLMIAMAFAQNGANIFLLGRDLKTLEEVQAYFSQKYPSQKFVAIKANLSVPEDCLVCI